MKQFGTDRLSLGKWLFFLSAILIAAGSLAVAHALTSDLAREEQNRVEVWAEAMRTLIRADENTDLSLVLRITEGNHTIPVVLLDGEGQIVDYRNVSLPHNADSLAYLQSEVEAMRHARHEMSINLPATPDGLPQETYTLCYGESVMLRRLAVYPYIQLAVVALFICVAVFALRTSWRSEQNKVWAGLSRETAHQLGTPISSLMAWTEVLADSHPDEPVVEDLRTDVARLQLIAERFSKIGSDPVLERQDLRPVLSQAVDYMSRRTPGKIALTLHQPESPVMAAVSAPLFAWVVENLCKNAVDAITGKGTIDVSLSLLPNGTAQILVSDTGRGIPPGLFKSVFRPGFTTKKRGWGLGLSLAKRIVEQYHGGRIFVKSSQVGVGTTFAIQLPCSPNR